MITWDNFGNLTSQTSPRGITTTSTYDYSHFALGELISVKEGSKTSTLYSYDQTDGYTDATGAFVPCGLLTAVASPTPGSASGSNNRVTASFVYDLTGRGNQPRGSLGLGNVVSVTAPGNNAVSAITTTFGYTGDGDRYHGPFAGPAPGRDGQPGAYHPSALRCTG